eukprot:scaffold18633_cov62-Isochrysis_galbana.AAC.2
MQYTAVRGGSHLQQLFRRRSLLWCGCEQCRHHRSCLRGHVPEGGLVKSPGARLDAALDQLVGSVTGWVEGVVASQQDEQEHAWATGGAEQGGGVS